MEKENIKVSCFGEVLWDNLPTGRQAGGAPLNVAYHLHKLDISSNLISKVGKDEDGQRLLEKIEELGLSTKYCGIDDKLATSTVGVKIDENEEVSYEIASPVAWDNIQQSDDYTCLAKNSHALVYGSLSGRNNVTQNTLLNLLNSSVLHVFDLNLREPFYSREYIKLLLKKTDILKVNLNELQILTNWFGKLKVNEFQCVEQLQQEFGIMEIIVTKGSAGASYYCKKEEYHESACKIKVKDTIGSGDSFLAAFLSKRLLNINPKDILRFAIGVSAFVTERFGGCPDYKIHELHKFIHENNLSETSLKLCK